MNEPLVITPCQASDSRDIWLWRNDETTRCMSINTGEVSWKEHEKWFASALSNKDRLLLIGRIGENSVGMVRFDKIGQDTLQVSINLNPEFRGKGLGKQLLKEALSIAEKKGTAQFIAEVKVENVPSNKLFSSLGFVVSETKNDANVYRLGK